MNKQLKKGKTVILKDRAVCVKVMSFLEKQKKDQHRWGTKQNKERGTREVVEVI